ncbi:MAG TPA: hypothetical protein VFN11_22410 [Ktedonobacterales bacterium]|nr:hypothetical protein [Ktedonobacterales bacterium]
MLTLKYRTRREERIATADRVMLADGSIIVVRRANLADAKALLAAERAAQRRMDALRAQRNIDEEATWAPTLATA